MPQNGLNVLMLNALITNNNQTTTKIVPNKTTSTNRLKSTNANQSNWHFQHYHNPYNFGLKTPNFHDYDSNNLLTFDHDFNFNLNLNSLDDNHAAPLKHYDHLAQLSCDSGEMILKLNFSEPFKGIVYPDHNRLSACRFFGDGHHNYELRLPLRGCGTRQVSWDRRTKRCRRRILALSLSLSLFAARSPA